MVIATLIWGTKEGFLVGVQLQVQVVTRYTDSDIDARDTTDVRYIPTLRTEETQLYIYRSTEELL